MASALYAFENSGPCGDTGHLGHYKNNWTELKWTEKCEWTQTVEPV